MARSVCPTFRGISCIGNLPEGKRRLDGQLETIEGIEIYRHKAWEASGIAGYLLEYTAALGMRVVPDS